MRSGKSPYLPPKSRLHTQQTMIPKAKPPEKAQEPNILTPTDPNNDRLVEMETIDDAKLDPIAKPFL